MSLCPHMYEGTIKDENGNRYECPYLCEHPDAAPWKLCLGYSILEEEIMGPNEDVIKRCQEHWAEREPKIILIGRRLGKKEDETS